uniref:Uncharacterized protein n=1 Tax=Megaselia scalaris TaxID=36166 RepID=T1GTB5_MEGSC
MSRFWFKIRISVFILFITCFNISFQYEDNGFVDLIKELDIPKIGVPAQGMCGQFHNNYQIHEYPAYSLTKDAILTVATHQAFPKGFPRDFSLL